MSTNGHGRSNEFGIARIDAITLATHDMHKALSFYRMLGGELEYGGPDTSFASFKLANLCLNLVLEPEEIQWSFWGRIVFHVADVDATYERLREAGIATEGEPRDAEWGERYVHVTDPDGHQLSFAKPLEGHKPARGHHPAEEVERASDASFPASDPPTFTPTTGSSKAG